MQKQSSRFTGNWPVSSSIIRLNSTPRAVAFNRGWFQPLSGCSTGWKRLGWFEPLQPHFNRGQFFSDVTQPVRAQAVSDFLLQYDKFYFVCLSLWICCWLAMTSHRPISWTIWLKVTPVIWSNLIFGSTLAIPWYSMITSQECWKQGTICALCLRTGTQCLLMRLNDSLMSLSEAVGLRF